MENHPRYEYWVILIDKNGNYIGYTHTQKEADDICMKTKDLTWEEGSEIIPNKKDRLETYKNLKQVTINDF